MGQGFAAQAKLDWKALEAEAVSLLSRYIQIDTTNVVEKHPELFKDAGLVLNEGGGFASMTRTASLVFDRLSDTVSY
jgi:hypothetical protein